MRASHPRFGLDLSPASARCASRPNVDVGIAHGDVTRPVAFGRAAGNLQTVPAWVASTLAFPGVQLAAGDTAMAIAPADTSMSTSLLASCIVAR